MMTKHLSFFIGYRCANFGNNQNQRIVFIMTDREIKTIELIINNEQAKKKLEVLKVRRLGLSQGV